jgi:hypothetical protein
MARRNSEEVLNPEVEAIVADETDEVETVEESNGKEAKAPKAPKEPKRGTLPEGYVTPVGLAGVLSERGLHQNRAGETVAVQPQMVYSYIRSAPKDDPAPVEIVTDSIGKERQALQVDKAIAWWERKNARVSERKQNAAAKAQKKAENAAKKEQAASEEVTEAEGTEAVVEAE